MRNLKYAGDEPAWEKKGIGIGNVGRAHGRLAETPFI